MKRIIEGRPTAAPRIVVRLTLVAALALLGGCSRAHYRRQADQAVECVVTQATDDARWRMEQFDVDPQPASRMYNPASDDCPPMPPDDPESHRLMHCVDGKQGWRYWHRNGDTPNVENPNFLQFLPRDENGVVVLDRQAAMEVALVNSSDYQSQLEQLYLSALSVTFERFRFDAQFFGGNSLFYTADGRVRGGGSSKSTWEQDNHLRMEKLFAGGGELVVGIANSLVWQVAGPDSYNANSILNFSLVQPLLRAGGRAVVLERLTDSERALLANLRQMEQYRRGFYCEIVAGRSPGPGPSSGGIGIPSVSGAGSFGGFLTLLEQQVRIRNQRNNVEGLRVGLEQVQAMFDAGRIDRLQLERAKQASLSAQSSYLVAKTAYDAGLDNYKMTLGLPPNVNLRVSDELLRRFDLIRPELDDLQNRLSDLVARTRANSEGVPDDAFTTLGEVRQKLLKQVDVVGQDVSQLDQALPRRRKELEALARLPEFQDLGAGGGFTTADLDARAAAVHKRLDDVGPAVIASLESIANDWLSDPPAPRTVSKERRELFIDAMVALDSQVLDLSLVQARARLEAISLPSIDLTSESALAVARENRPDWMNARAALVDSWRQIEVAANALMSDLNLTVSGDIGTLGNNPVRFRDTTGRLRMGVEFDAPLTRVAARNAYRAAQINYEQQRRAFYQFEDRVQQVLRNELRDVRFNAIDFETQRATVTAAIEQVAITRERITAPPPLPPATGALSPTTVNDMVIALNGLLDAQNSLLRIWLSSDVLRMNLDFDMGTMQLDDRGLWIDPGPIDGAYLESAAARSGAESTPRSEASTAGASPIPASRPEGGAVPEETLPEQPVRPVNPGAGQGPAVPPLPVPPPPPPQLQSQLPSHNPAFPPSRETNINDEPAAIGAMHADISRWRFR